MRPLNFEKVLQTTEEIVITETFAETSENWEVLSNCNLTGRISGLSCSFMCEISNSLFDVQFLTCQLYPSICDVTGQAIYREIGPQNKTMFSKQQNIICNIFTI